MFNYLRFRYRRQIRLVQRRLTRLQRRYTGYADRHLRGKWYQLRLIRRFVILWGIIILLSVFGVIGQIRSLNDRARVSIARNGGILREAAVGTVKNLNPILPENSISADMNRLVFSGLTQHNNNRKITPDLASSWDISPDGKTYTFHLRRNIVWHDGVPFGAPDVVFTLAAIQNPDSRSPLSSSWQGVKAEAKGDDTVIFTLPNALSSFLDATTIGILPRHILESVDPSSLRENGFNQHPIGTGPFKIKAFATAANEISFEANAKYYAGKPKLDGYRFDLYSTKDEAVNAYASRRVDALGNITPEIIKTASNLKALTSYDYKLPEEVNVFFRTDDEILKNKDLRRILSASVDRKKVIQAADYGLGLAISQPLLPGEPGYTTAFALVQQSNDATRSALKAAGWESKGPGPRQKDGKRLKLSLVTLQGGELERAANELKRQWHDLGIEVTVKAFPRSELEQSYIRTRHYQLLLYGINLGGDPDVYAFWHSSQIKDPGINLSNYSSSEADKALEAGRIKQDTLVRKGKYQAFLKAWNADSPAVVLYEPIYRYGISSSAKGFEAGPLVEPSDRFFNVQEWTILTEKISRYRLKT